MRIRNAAIEYIAEPLKAVFAFKGKYNARPMWNTAVHLTGDAGTEATGLSTPPQILGQIAEQLLHQHKASKRKQHHEKHLAGRPRQNVDEHEQCGHAQQTCWACPN